MTDQKASSDLEEVLTKRAYNLRLAGREFEINGPTLSDVGVVGFLTEMYCDLSSSFDRQSSPLASDLLIFPGTTTVRLWGYVDCHKQFSTMTLHRDDDALVLDNLFGSKKSPLRINATPWFKTIDQKDDGVGLGISATISYGGNCNLEISIPAPRPQHVEHHRHLDPITSQQRYWSLIDAYAHDRLQQKGWHGQGLDTRFHFITQIPTALGTTLLLHLYRGDGEVPNSPYVVETQIPPKYGVSIEQMEHLGKRSGCDTLILDGKRLTLDNQVNPYESIVGKSLPNPSQPIREIRAEFSSRPEGVLTFMHDLNEMHEMRSATKHKKGKQKK